MRMTQVTDLFISFYLVGTLRWWMMRDFNLLRVSPLEWQEMTNDSNQSAVTCVTARQTRLKMSYCLIFPDFPLRSTFLKPNIFLIAPGEPQ